MKKLAAAPVLAMIPMLNLAAAAAPPDADRLLACAKVEASSERLGCFDREAARLAVLLREAAPVPAAVLPPAPPAVPAPVPAASAATAPVLPPVMPSPPSATASIGQEQLAGKQGQEAAEKILHARVTAQRKVGSSAFIVTLDNGQSWRHEDLHQSEYLREGDAITIRQAAMGSYRLTRDAGKVRDWIRVTRVR